MKNISAVKNIIALASNDVGFVHGGKGACPCSNPKNATKVIHSFKKGAVEYLDRNRKKLHKKMPW